MFGYRRHSLIILSFILSTCFVILGCRAKEVPPPPVIEGSDLIGRKAPPLKARDWIQSKPLAIDDLQGEVILVHFWTGPNHPIVSKSSEALNLLYQQYQNQGFRMIGLYYHEAHEKLKKRNVKKLVTDLNYQFPIAIDREWKTLRQWWLDEKDRDWMTVSFLIDQNGVIQDVRSGVVLEKGNEDYEELEDKILELLYPDLTETNA